MPCFDVQIYNAVSSSAVSRHSWNWLATVFLSSPSFSFCQIGKSVGKSLELEWWLMTRLLWCTLPCWRTLTLLHFSALIGQPCKLPCLCTWGPSLSQPPTQGSGWAILFWLSAGHKPPPSTAVTYCGPIYCLVLERKVGMSQIGDENLWIYLRISRTFYACGPKKWPLCTYTIHHNRDTKQWQSNTIQTTAIWYSPGLCCEPRCNLGLALFVSPDFIKGDLHNLRYVYKAFMKMDISWHNLD